MNFEYWIAEIEKVGLKQIWNIWLKAYSITNDDSKFERVNYTGRDGIFAQVIAKVINDLHR